METTGTQPTFSFGQGGIFRAMEDSVYSRYAVALNWRDRLAGGTPSDPKLIEGWLKSKMPGMTSDIERRHMLVRTLEDMGTTLPEGTDIMSISMEQLEEAAAKVAASRGMNGFKRPNRVVVEEPVLDADGSPVFEKDGAPKTQMRVIHPGYLAIETRHLKSGIKEWINILFAGTRWGLTKKAPKSFAAERVFINSLLDPAIIGEEVYLELTVPDARDARKRVAKYPDFLFLTKYNESGDGGPMFTMLTEPDAVETFIGHVSGPQGPRSNLTRVEVVSGATIHVDMQVLRDEIQHHHWPIIFLAGQENGLGAMRSQGYGRFDIVRFERTGGKYQPLDWDTIVKQVDADAILRDYQRTKDAKIAAGEITGEGTEGLVPLTASEKKALKGSKNGAKAVITQS
jgi:hypothetical protein